MKMKIRSALKKIAAAFLCVGILAGTSAATIVAGRAASSGGTLGVFYCIYTNTNGKDGLVTHEIKNSVYASVLVNTLNECYKREETDPVLSAVHVELYDDLTTSNFLRNDDFALSVDLGGHTWTVTETNYDRKLTASMQGTRANYHDISISNGTMTFKQNDTSPIACCGGTITIDHVTFKDCYSDADSIYSDLYPSQRYFGIVNLQVRTNDTGLEDTTGTKLQMRNVTFSGCGSTHGGTCVAAWLPGCKIEIEDCLFENCYTTGTEGGVFYTREDSQDVTFRNCRFTNCHAYNEGGVIDVEDDYGTYRFENCIATNCYSEDSDGGFLFVDGEHNRFLGGDNYDDRTMIIGCRAASDGGAIYASMASGCGNYNTFTGFNFYDCTAGKAHDLAVLRDDGGDHDGGAIFLGGSYNTVTNCDFYRNYAEDGGAVFMEYGNGTIRNCTFECNESWDNEGHAVYVNASGCSVTDSVFRGGWILSAEIAGDECFQSGLSAYGEDAVDSFFKGNGTKEDPYLISDGYEMNWFTQNTKGYKSTYEGKYFKLTNNIRMYIPAGSYTDKESSPVYQAAKIDQYIRKYLPHMLEDAYYYRPFSGDFDGDGHTIELILPNGEDFTAVFGYAKGANIHDLTVEGEIHGRNNTGGIVGFADGCTIENCRNKAAVSGSVDSTAGIAGLANDTTIKNCVNNGKIGGHYMTGGIAGHTTGSTVIENCANHGEIYGSHMSVGGIAAECSQVAIKNCVNNAPVTVMSGYVGGIAAVVHNGTVQNCVNTANGTVGMLVSSADRAGGIVGATFNDIPVAIKNCGNYGAVTTSNGCGVIDHVEGNLTVTGCFNAGAIAKGSNNGPITTGNGGGKFSQCFYLSDGISDTHGTALSAEDCGKKLAARMNNYITDNKLSSDGWATWTVGGSDYLNCAAVSLQDAETGYLPGSGTVKDPYLITSASALQHISDELLQGNDFYGKYLILQKNLTGALPAPLGDEGHPFRGFFDGRDHFVTVKISGGNCAGLFASLRDATIQNLTVKGTVNTGDASVKYLGAFAGTCYNSTIRGCISEATVNSVSTASGIPAGGFVGFAEKSTLYDCCNYGKVTSIKGYAGGIVGKGSYTNIDLCLNAGEIYGNIAGGILGSMVFETNVLNCSNESGGSVSAGSNAGGIVGKTSDYLKKLIANCANFASVSADSGSAGGILGGEIRRRNDYTEEESERRRSLPDGLSGGSYTAPILPNELTVENCFSSGKVAAGENAGSIAALDATSTFINCCYLNGKGPADTSHGRGFTASQCKMTSATSPLGLLNELAETRSYAKWKKLGSAPALIRDPIKYTFAEQASSNGFASVFANGSVLWLLGLLGAGVGAMAIIAVVVKKKKKKPAAVQVEDEE